MCGIGQSRPGAVRDAEYAGSFGMAGDALKHRHPDLLGIRLNNIDSPAIDETVEIPLCHQTLPRGDAGPGAGGEAGEVLDIVRVQRFLEEI